MSEHNITDAGQNTICILVVEPMKTPYTANIENDFEAMQKIVGGCIEFVPLPDSDCHIYCNDEGKLDGLQGNRRMDNEDIICGTFFICADDGEGCDCSLNDEQVARYMERFGEPERFTDEEAHRFEYEISVIADERSGVEKFTDYINGNILPFIDYHELAKSYRTEDKAYAKGILNRLHTAMVEQYGSTTLTPGYRSPEDDYVVVPGIIEGKKTGKIAIALLGIDLASSGEHCQTDILCHYGVVSQGDKSLPPYISAEVSVDYMPYDYGYTADIQGDIHISKTRLPDGIKDMLGSFQNCTAELLRPDAETEEEQDMER